MSNSDVLFLRQGELIVGPKVTSTNGPIEPVNARVFRTRIGFSITFDGSSNANKAKIRVYNLSPDSRTFLEQKDMVCFLNVGYESGELQNLFFGDIDDKNGIHVERNGPDIITTIEAGDAEKTLRTARINIGLAAGATNRQVITEAVKQLNVSISSIETIPLRTFQNGYSFIGQAKDVLDIEFKKVGLNWNIQNGELLVLSPGKTDQQVAVVVSPKTGLIGFPTKTQDKVIFKSLLNPAIRPGRAIILESQIFKDGQGATVKTNKATFEGDTHQGSWSVEVEGKII